MKGTNDDRILPEVQREPRDAGATEQITMKNGRAATRGKCAECGAAMFRIGTAS